MDYYKIMKYPLNKLYVITYVILCNFACLFAAPSNDLGPNELGPPDNHPGGGNSSGGGPPDGFPPGPPIVPEANVWLTVLMLAAAVVLYTHLIRRHVRRRVTK
jgi:hypothetical protein